MSIVLISRDATVIANPSNEAIRHCIDSLNEAGSASESVSLTYELKARLTYYRNGLLLWEYGLSGTEPKYLRNLSVDMVLEVFERLAKRGPEPVDGWLWREGPSIRSVSGKRVPMTPEDYLDKVVDQASFIRFVEALADEREAAERLEATQSGVYYDGAYNWKNADISSFLSAAVQYFKPDATTTPSWRMMAEFLYCGKIYE